MAITFFCSHCGRRKFFSEYKLFQDDKVCLSCFDKIVSLHDEEVRRKKEAIRVAYEKKVLKRKDNSKKADIELKKQLELDKQKEAAKEKKALQKKESQKRKKHDSLGNSTLSEAVESNTIQVSLEDEARLLSKKYNRVLYVFADVKNIKAIEWVSGKKRVALNKTREIRRTHKGGFSQEKFQRFVDHQKKATSKWVEEHLTAPGVLRGPYDKVIVDVGSGVLRKSIEKCVR